MERRLKDIKKSIVRKLALWLSLFYILNPIQKPLYDILHNVTHNLSMPSFVAGHLDIGTAGAKIHSIHVHQAVDTAHEHSILNVLASIFEALDNNPDNNSQITHFELDKHFPLAGASYELFGIATHLNPFINFKMELPFGFLYKILRPPILFF